MTGTAIAAGVAMPADDGWAIFALPAGTRDLALEEYWEASIERSRRRRAAKRRPRVVKGGTSRVSLALAAVALAAPAATGAMGAESAAAATTTAAPSLAIGRGSTGAAVQALQQKLGITADGIFGPQTERAVRPEDGGKFYDPAYISCTGLIADVGRDVYGFDTAPFADLIRWANIVDGAPHQRSACGLLRSERTRSSADCDPISSQRTSTLELTASNRFSKSPSSSFP